MIQASGMSNRVPFHISSKYCQSYWRFLLSPWIACKWQVAVTRLTEFRWSFSIFWTFCPWNLPRFISTNLRQKAQAQGPNAMPLLAKWNWRPHLRCKIKEAKVGSSWSKWRNKKAWESKRVSFSFLGMHHIKRMFQCSDLFQHHQCHPVSAPISTSIHVASNITQLCNDCGQRH